VASGISGFLVIWGLLKYLRTHSFAAFMWYRFAVAGIIFVLIASGARSATI
jgi:undecaprenyl pyrophosphate phosphatase UppP